MSRPHMTLGLASSNRATMAELRASLGDYAIEVMPAHRLLDGPMSALDNDHDFATKALRKAELLARTAMVLAVGEAAGLEVTALGGEPGVRSARFAGWGATDAENNTELLQRLQEVEDRSARYVCALALVDPWSDGEPYVATACCRGHIAHKPSDAGGFGYEPLFIVDGHDCSLAELSAEKRRVSDHRCQAMGQLLPVLTALLQQRLP